MLKDYKTYIIIVVGIVVGLVTYINLPKRVEAIEAKLVENKEKAEKYIKETDDKVQQVAQTLDTYMAVQAAEEKQDTEHRALLMQLLGKLAKWLNQLITLK